MLNKKLFSIFSLSILLGLGCLASCGGNNGDQTTPTPTPTTPEPKDTYEVSFYVDGNLYGETLTVNAGEKIAKPADPTREADEDYTYTFAGWYENGAETAWNFETDVVNKDLDLFAEFEEVARAYDLIVYVLGGSDSTVYITEDEIARVESTFESKHSDKDVLFKFFPAMKNDAFNAKVLSVKNKPDVIISGSKMDSGDNALTLNTTYPKTKVGLGWFSSTTRYVGVYEACSEHLELAANLFEDMTTAGPDYFELDSAAVTLKVNESKTITPSFKEGETRTLTWKSLNEEIATVVDGAITGVAEGSAIVTATLGLVTVEVEVSVVANVEYDLVVFAQYGSSGSTVYLNDEEFEFIKEEFAKVADIAGLNLYWENVKGLAVADFNQYVNNTIADGFVVDVVIAGGNMNVDGYNPISLDSTYTKVNVGKGWVETSTNRRVAITEACDKNMELAIKLYDMLSATGPKFEGIELDRTSATMTVGAQITLNATVYGEVSWVSDNEGVATVENGVVTAISAGTAKITAMTEKGLTAVCTITVEAATIEPLHDLVVYVHASASSTYVSEQELTAIQEAFTAEGAAGHGKDIKWVVVEGEKNAGFAEAFAGYEEGEEPDVVIGPNSGLSETSSSTYGLNLYNDEYPAVHSSWVANDKVRIAIIEDTYHAEHVELASALIALVTEAKPAGEEPEVPGPEVQENYDLVVMVYLAASKSTYITTEEYEAIVAAFTAEGAAGHGKNILWLTYTGGNQEALSSYYAGQVAEGNVADVVIARSGMSTGKVPSLTIDSTSYVAIDVSWAAADGNFIAFNSVAAEGHKELGNALISMLTTAKAA